MPRFQVVYQPATAPTSGPQPGAIALRNWILNNYPMLGDLGIYNNRSIRGSRSLSTHAEGRAIDIGTPSETAPTEPARKAGWALALRLRHHHPDLGIQSIIYDRKRWSNQQTDWRPYTGRNPHLGHLHIELTWQAATELTPTMIHETLGGTTMPTRPDRTDNIKQIQRIIIDSGHATAWWIDGKRRIPEDDDYATDHARYIDGDLGDTTTADLLRLLAENGQADATADTLNPIDPDMQAKASHWDRLHAALIALGVAQ